MYIPPHNGPPSEDDVTRLLLATQAGDLVTVGDDGLTVSMIPFLYDASRPPRPPLLRAHDDPEGPRDAGERLPRAHENGRAEPWAVSDAPAPYITGQLRAIVGIE